MMTNAKSQTVPEAAWAESLALFLLEEQGVEAVRLDRAAGKVSVATLGQVDFETLRGKLSAVIDAHRREFGTGPAESARAPAGFRLVKDEHGTVLQKETCATAPRFYRWREFDWPEEEAVDKTPEWKVLAVLAATCGGLSILAYGIESAGVGPAWLAPAIFVAAMLAGGWDALGDVRENLPKGDMDIHFLMLAVAVGASLIGAFGEGALLLFLFSTSSALEDFAMHRTHREINALLHAAPKTATRLLDGGADETETVPVEALRVRDRLLVRPGEQFPVDGVVLVGRTAADESNLSGEALPVEKDVGEEVSGGTLNLWGAVEIRVLRPASQSALQKIISLIKNAQKLRAPSERFTDKFGGRYTVFVLGFCAVMFFVWWLGFGVAPFTDGAEYSAFYRAMTLLVVMSPCALVLSIPSAILAAIAWGARHGILFRGGAAIEKLAEVSIVALDKTGTLTTGELSVTGIESFPPGREKEVLEIAFALESRSQHPIARAIVTHGRREGMRSEAVDEFHSLTGKGVAGRLREANALLGRRELMDEGPFREWIQSVPAPGPEMSEVWILHDDLIGRILLRDQIRAESGPVLAELKRQSIRSVMLTGDRRHAAEAVAHELGVDDVRAGLSPEQKVQAIRELGAGGRRVAMVGDGVNDAPSLAAAYVAVAMGARGSDAALEQSEVVLVNDKIENFLAAFRLSQRARAIIKQNLFISLGTVVLMALAATLGIVPLTLGVAAHEGSTVVVCLNSLRLLFGGEK